ncbi:SDR family NAD(P)-dependent oxidoreductase [Pseudoramibacter sp. HA2172]|uniref:SDR family NAD(P)-dependent oxidoreductase n=1 Tax=Pseudoramibacter faecis TaxID=3108534 RepID=UPI002E771E8D|nr:SDR family NAD(P)-dependent oxidoreductase [Pseudoramibacter sp. HA2172]
MTDTAMVGEAVRTILDRFGRIDILVNNAGTGGVAPAEDITDEQFKNEPDIDLFGTFKMAREVAKKTMLPQGCGRVISIASVCGMAGNKIAPASPYVNGVVLPVDGGYTAM